MQKEAVSLYQALEKVQDRRGRKGKRYPLALLFLLLLLGKMAGETKLEGIVDWLKEREYEIKKLLHWPKALPVSRTYVAALSCCDHREVTQAITQVILRAKREKEKKRKEEEKGRKKENEQFSHVALDGKKLCGTLHHEKENQPPVHLLTFYDCEKSMAVAQFLVKKEQNEESACKDILHPILVKDRIITADAIFSCRDLCARIRAYYGHYMIPIKNNNPAVLRDIQEFFDDTGIDRKEFQYYKEVNKGHGRLEVREIWASTQMNEWFQREWVDIAQVYKIRRTRKRGEKEEQEVVYGITSVPREIIDAKQLLKLNREHWHIENRLHYRKDVTLGEDASQIRMKGAPEVFAALNGGLLAFLDFLGVKNRAKFMRHCCAAPKDAVDLLIHAL